MSEHARITVDSDQAGLRLDKVLAGTGMGLRAARRLCAEGRALVNGRPGREAYKVGTGDMVEIKAGGSTAEGVGGLAARARVIAASPLLAALFKPAGLHTASLAGGGGESLESALPRLLPGETESGFPILLNRLDRPTSGLVLAARAREGQAAWKRGPLEKRYLALLEGDAAGEILVKKRLDLRNPRQVKAEADDDPDPSRHTLIQGLAGAPAREIMARLGLKSAGVGSGLLTLAGCAIVRGARHQIRVHVASAGFPLLGDVRYGGTAIHGAGQAANPSRREEWFYLHHGYVGFPGFSAAAKPEWLAALPPVWQEMARQWLAATADD